MKAVNECFPAEVSHDENKLRKKKSPNFHFNALLENFMKYREHPGQFEDDF